MPEPTIFLNSKFGPVSIIRPTDPDLAAQGAVQSFVDEGLFINPATGQNSGIVAALMHQPFAANSRRESLTVQ